MSRSPKPTTPSPGRPHQAEPVHPALRRRRSHCEPGTGGQSTGAGRDQGLRHQPGRLSRRHARDRGVRNRLLPPALPDRTLVPDGQERPAGQAGLPPPARLDRSPPDHRLRRHVAPIGHRRHERASSRLPGRLVSQPSAPEFGELPGKGPALVETGSSGGRARRRIHQIDAECVAGTAIREDGFDSAAACT
jgi:hypothetical protein